MKKIFVSIILLAALSVRAQQSTVADCDKEQLKTLEGNIHKLITDNITFFRTLLAGNE